MVPGGRRLGLLEHHVGILEHVAGLRLERLGAEGDPAVDLVVVDDHALDLLAGLEDLLEVVDPVVRDLRDVEEAGHAADLDEGAVGLEGLDHAVDDVAAGEVGHLLLDDGPAVGNDELVVLLVDLEEFEGDLGPDDLLGGHHAGEVGAGEEGAEALDGADGAAAVDGDDLGVEDLIVGLAGDDAVPGGLVLDALDGDEELAVLVLLGDDLELHLGPNVDEAGDVVALLLDEGGLLGGEEGRGLGPDVDNGAGHVVLDDGALDDVVAVEGVFGVCDGVVEVGVGEVQAGVVDLGAGALVLRLEAVEAGQLRLGGLGRRLGLRDGGVKAGGAGAVIWFGLVRFGSVRCILYLQKVEGKMHCIVRKRTQSIGEIYVCCEKDLLLKTAIDILASFRCQAKGGSVVCFLHFARPLPKSSDMSVLSHPWAKHRKAPPKPGHFCFSKAEQARRSVEQGGNGLAACRRNHLRRVLGDICHLSGRRPAAKRCATPNLQRNARRPDQTILEAKPSAA